METKLLDGIEKEAMHPIVGAALGAGVATGGLIAIDPYFRGSTLSFVKSLLNKKKAETSEDAANQKHPNEAYNRASDVAKTLKQMKFDPKRHNLAIAATGGTGKSTLAALLADKMKLQRTYRTGAKSTFSSTGRSFGSEVMKRGTKPGHVYEQTHLFNTVDPNKFDYLIKLERPTKEIYKSLKDRKRGSLQRHLSDYPRLKKAINFAFDSLEGKAISPEKGISIKKKPEGGFHQKALMDKKIIEMGGDPEGMSREEKIYKITGGDSKAYKILSKLGLPKIAPKIFSPDANYTKMFGITGVIGTGALTGGLIAK